jgi:hypothetical protein
MYIVSKGEIKQPTAPLHKPEFRAVMYSSGCSFVPFFSGPWRKPSIGLDMDLIWSKHDLRLDDFTMARAPDFVWSCGRISVWSSSGIPKCAEMGGTAKKSEVITVFIF